MALEIVTVFEIEVPRLPACVTSSSSLNLRFFNNKSGSALHDKVGAQGIVVCPVCPPLVILSKLGQCGPNTELFS